MRLFIAVHFSQAVKQVLIHTMDELRRQSVSGNFTRPENLHLTLAFLGETKEVEAAKNAIDQSVVSTFSITVGGFGHFGSLYWVGIEDNPQLADLAKQLHSTLRGSGFQIEDRKFTPHITVARQVRINCRPRVLVPNVTMPVSRISLMKSERMDGKLVYTELYGRNLL